METHRYTLVHVHLMMVIIRPWSMLVKDICHVVWIWRFNFSSSLNPLQDIRHIEFHDIWSWAASIHWLPAIFKMSSVHQPVILCWSPSYPGAWFWTQTIRSSRKMPESFKKSISSWWFWNRLIQFPSNIQKSDIEIWAPFLEMNGHGRSQGGYGGSNPPKYLKCWQNL